MEDASVRGGNLEVVELLLLRGGDIEVVDAEGNSLLHQAVFFGQREIALKLLEINRNLFTRAVNNSGRTVLHMASRRGRYWITKVLIESGCDVNAADEDGVSCHKPETGKWRNCWLLLKSYAIPMAACQELVSELIFAVPIAMALNVVL